MNRDPHDIILRPILTERSYDGIAKMHYTFYVALDANKVEIARAVEAVFPGTKVESVNTLRQLGKMKRQGRTQGRRVERKKAFVQLAKDSKPIEFFEGMA